MTQRIEAAKLLIRIIFQNETTEGEQPLEVQEAEKQLQEWGWMSNEGTFSSEMPDELWDYIESEF